MSAKKMGLGRGLNTLIPKAPIVDEEDIEQVKKKVSRSSKTKKKEETKKELTLPIDKIEPNPDQPRNQFDEDTLQELADSIKQYGMLQPILVTPKDDFYEIIAGERRWRAAKQAGLNEVPVMIRKYNENEIVEIALIENIQRDNLNPIEEAMAYKRLQQELNLTQEELSKKVGKSRSHVTNMMGLLTLPEEVKDMIITKEISMGHARILSKLDDKEQIKKLANDVVVKKLSVRQLEDLTSNNTNFERKNKIERLPRKEDTEYSYLEDSLSEKLGTRVKIKKNKVQINFTNSNDLNRILEIMNLNK